MSNLYIKNAEERDLIALINLLNDDDLGNEREDNTTPPIQSYINAFNEIQSDTNNKITVAILNDKVIGMMQVTFIPGLSMKGSKRCQIESVRIHKDYRNRGFGKKLINKGIEMAKKKNCSMVQLTSNKKRKDAIKFYKNVGFSSTHQSFKLELRNQNQDGREV